MVGLCSLTSCTLNCLHALVTIIPNPANTTKAARSFVCVCVWDREGEREGEGEGEGEEWPHIHDFPQTDWPWFFPALIPLKLLRFSAASSQRVHVYQTWALFLCISSKKNTNIVQKVVMQYKIA